MLKIGKVDVELSGFIILKSSKNNYHVVFDRKVSWGRNIEIMAWVCLLTKYQKLTGWFILQGIKHGSTLRVFPKDDELLRESCFDMVLSAVRLRSFLFIAGLSRA